MKRYGLQLLVLALALAGSLFAQGNIALPAEPMVMDPDQVMQSLRDTEPPMPPTDCRALELEVCDRSFPQKVEDVSIRWIQLDDDPQLEAIVTVYDKIAAAYSSFVFKKRPAWRLVGLFRCPRTCDETSFLRVQKLTPDSPSLVVFHRETSGRGLKETATLGYLMRQGRLFPALEVINHSSAEGRRPFVENVEMTPADNRLVIHTMREEPPRSAPQNTCQVRGWDTAKNAFMPVPSDQSVYCDSRTGKPITDKGPPPGLPFP